MKQAEYESKSVGHWIYVLAGLFAIGGVGIAVMQELEEGQGVFIGLAILVFSLILVSFATLTVRVTQREIAWSFGGGVIGRRIKLERVRGVEAKRSAWYWGWGIRWTPRGWLWRSYGLDAVWLELENGRRVGIGTQDPEGLERAIRRRTTSARFR